MSSDQNIQNSDKFRDQLSTVDKTGKRIWVYPKKPSGKYFNYRTWLSYLYFIILFGLPFIKVNGEPFILVNILERNFILFGMHFGPQDFYLFAIAMLIFLVFIILFTVVFGRLFCGWICPQTIFMELVYRKIEYAIDGDYNAQKKLNAAPWTSDKIMKRALKHFLFFSIAVLIANTFLAYIIGIDEVIKIISEPISLHFGGFVSMIIFSFVFYIVFTRLREQVCTTICPYGRLQGVMLDNKSLVVAYDFVRGEPRGKIQKNKLPDVASSSINIADDYIASVQNKLGDCIDCKLCVHVCPTGIDIRNGTQLECVNCTACMDACDEVMEKIDRPKGLVRIDSLDGIEKGEHKLFNIRTIAYSAVLLILIGVEIVLFSLRSDVEVLFLRTGGLLSQEQADGSISNLYNYQMINKTADSLTVEFKMIEPKSGTFEIIGGKKPAVSKNSKSEGAVFIKIPETMLDGGKNKILIGVYSGDKLITKVNTTFFSPVK